MRLSTQYAIDPVSEAQPKVMPERITDHPAPTAGEITQALVREHESTSGSGNQGPAMASSPSPAPAPADDDAPWLVVALLIAAAALGAAALTVVVRRNRPRVAA